MTTYNHSIDATDLDPPAVLFSPSPTSVTWESTLEFRDPRTAHPAASQARQALMWKAVAYLFTLVALVGGAQAIWLAVGTDAYASVRQAYLGYTTPAIPIAGDDPTFVTPPRASASAPLLRGAPSDQEGDVVGRIVIDAIDIDWLVVNGISVEALKSGPGWMPHTAFPGEPGNAVLSGHRTTYGAPFNRLDELVPGDTIKIAVEGRQTAVYTVRESFVVAPTDVWVIDPLPGAWLTLTTCTPEGTATNRLIIRAELTSGEFASYASSVSSQALVTSNRPTTGQPLAEIPST